MERRIFYAEDIIMSARKLYGSVTDDCIRSGITELVCELLGISNDTLEEIIRKDMELEAMWNELEDVPVNEDNCLDADWNGFPKGTYVCKIRLYFNEHHSKVVGWLMNEYEEGIL